MRGMPPGGLKAGPVRDERYWCCTRTILAFLAVVIDLLTNANCNGQISRLAVKVIDPPRPLCDSSNRKMVTTLLDEAVQFAACGSFDLSFAR